jgi:hypothetical protein
MLPLNHLQVLDNLCTKHNVLQGELVNTETKHQQLVQDAISYEPDIAKAIQHLHKLRRHITKCIRMGFAGIST